MAIINTSKGRTEDPNKEPRVPLVVGETRALWQVILIRKKQSLKLVVIMATWLDDE